MQACHVTLSQAGYCVCRCGRPDNLGCDHRRRGRARGSAPWQIDPAVSPHTSRNLILVSAPRYEKSTRSYILIKTNVTNFFTDTIFLYFTQQQPLYFNDKIMNFEK